MFFRVRHVDQQRRGYSAQHYWTNAGGVGDCIFSTLSFQIQTKRPLSLPVTPSYDFNFIFYLLFTFPDDNKNASSCLVETGHLPPPAQFGRPSRLKWLREVPPQIHLHNPKKNTKSQENERASTTLLRTVTSKTSIYVEIVKVYS